MYVPKCITAYLEENHAWEKRKLLYEKCNENYPPFDGTGGCEEYMRKLTEAVKDFMPKEWDEIIPFEYFAEKYKGYDYEQLMKTKGK